MKHALIIVLLLVTGCIQPQIGVQTTGKNPSTTLSKNAITAQSAETAISGWNAIMGNEQSPTTKTHSKTHSIRLREDPKQGILFEARTIKSFPCANYRITGSLGMQGSTISVRLGQVKKTEKCKATPEPATFSKRVDLKVGTYTMTVNDQDEYMVIVTDKDVKIEEVRAEITDLEKTGFKRA